MSTTHQLAHDEPSADEMAARERSQRELDDWRNHVRLAHRKAIVAADARSGTLEVTVPLLGENGERLATLRRSLDYVLAAGDDLNAEYLIPLTATVMGERHDVSISFAGDGKPFDDAGKPIRVTTRAVRVKPIEVSETRAKRVDGNSPGLNVTQFKYPPVAELERGEIL